MAFSSKVVDFGGTNEYVTMGNVLGFEYTQPRSFSWWSSWLPPASAGIFVSKIDGSPAYRGFQIYPQNDGKITAMLISNYATPNYASKTTVGVFGDGRRHHICVTWDGNATPGVGGLKIYVDGVEVSTTTNSDTLSGTILNSSPFILGSRADGALYYIGIMDEVSVYETKLTPTQVAWIYNSGTPRDLYGSGAPPGLVAWWRMGEGDLASSLILLDSGPSAAPNMVRDISGNSYHGTMTNMESSDVVYDAPGVPRSVLFGGVDEYVTMGNVLGFATSDDFSLAGWVKSSVNAAHTLIAKYQVGPAQGYQVYTFQNRLYLELMNNDTNVTMVYGALPSGQAYDGLWHHFAVSWDGNASVPQEDGIKLYWDGVALTPTMVSNSLGSNSIQSTTAFTLGNIFWLVGGLDEVAVYDKVLSPSEVTWIYNNGVPRNLTLIGAPSQLQAWWRMGDGDTFPTLQDQTANNYDGTMTSMEATDIVGDSPGHWGFDMRSLQFDGTNEYVTMGNVLGFEKTDPYSISAWVKSTMSSAWYIVSKEDTGTGWTFGQSATGYLQASQDNSGAFWLGVGCNTSPINDGLWHHVVFSSDGSVTPAGFKFYVDGAEVTDKTTLSNNLTSTIVNAAAPFNVNGRSGGTLTGAAGVDEVAVHNKVLSNSEVAWIYNAGVPRDLRETGAPSNLVGYWRMGENAYPGTMTNMESTDIRSTDIQRFESDPLDAVFLDEDGHAWFMAGGGGAGPTVQMKYKMRAQETGAAPPGYVTWVADDAPDFLGAGYWGGSPTPVGAMVVGSAVVVAEYEVIP